MSTEVSVAFSCGQRFVASANPSRACGWLFILLLLLTMPAAFAQPVPPTIAQPVPLPQAITTLIERLLAPDSAQRQAATDQLISIGVPAMEPLITAMRDPRPEMRCAVLRVLMSLSLGDRDNMLLQQQRWQVFIDASKDPNPGVRWCAASYLRLLHDGLTSFNDIARVTGTLSQDTDPAIRAASVLLLGDLSRAMRGGSLGFNNVGFMNELFLPDSAIDVALQDVDPAVNSAGIATLASIGPTASSSVLNLLQSPAPTVRRNATAVLRAIGNADDAAPLIFAFSDPDPLVRSGARDAVVHIGLPAVPLLADALVSADTFTRMLAASAIGDIARRRDPQQRRPYDELLSVENRKTTPPDSAIMAKLRESDITNTLIKLTADADKSIRSAAITALGAIGDRAALKPLLSFAQNDVDPRIRFKSIQALGELADPAAVPLLIEMLKAQPELARYIAQALGMIGDPRALPAVQAYLQTLPPTNQPEIIALLANFGSAGIAPLRTLVAQRELPCRYSAMRALARINDPQVLPILTVIAKDPSDKLRDGAIALLGDTGPAAIPTLEELLRDANSDIRSDAAYALVSIGAPADEALTRASNDPRPEIRSMAVSALGRRQSSRVIPAIVSHLTDQELDVRATAFHALAGIKSPLAIDALLVALQAPTPDTRSWAATVLGEDAHAFRTVDPLIVALDDPDTQVRRCAAWALGFLNDKRAVDPLIARLRDEPRVIWGAAHSLATLKDRKAIPALIAALDRPDDDGLHHDITEALQSLTGQNIGDDAVRWRAWWAKEGM